MSAADAPSTPNPFPFELSFFFLCIYIYIIKRSSFIQKKKKNTSDVQPHRTVSAYTIAVKLSSNKTCTKGEKKTPEEAAGLFTKSTAFSLARRRDFCSFFFLRDPTSDFPPFCHYIYTQVRIRGGRRNVKNDPRSICCKSVLI